MIPAEQLTGADADHGEGPVWHPGWDGLRWVDMLAGDVLHLTRRGTVERWHVGDVAAALRPRSGGGVVVATERDFVLAAEPDGPLEVVATPLTDAAIRFNDGGCDPQGRFLCGTMAYDETPGAGRLYRLDPDRSVAVVLEGVTISNGIAWSADGRRAFYVDSPTGRVDVFDDDGAGGLADRRPHAVIPAAQGVPDGIAIDAEGGVWVALWGGGAVHRYDVDGALDAVIELPAPKVTACTFGGPALDELYITTSRAGESPPSHAGAGALFRASPGVRGLPVRPFAG